jgi:hypothetical protein
LEVYTGAASQKVMILFIPKNELSNDVTLPTKMIRRVIISSLCGRDVSSDVAIGFRYNRQYGLLSDSVITGMFFYTLNGCRCLMPFFGV